MAKDSVTFEGVIQLALAEDHSQAVDGAGVELDPEDHVPTWPLEPLVVTLQLEGIGIIGQSNNRPIDVAAASEFKELGLCVCFKYSYFLSKCFVCVEVWVCSWRGGVYQNVSFEQKAWFYGDADTGVAVSLDVTAEANPEQVIMLA